MSEFGRPGFGPRPPFRHIEVAGSPRQLGISHGRQAADLIEASVRTYQDRFRAEAGLSWDRALELSRSIGQAIGDYDADLFTEMEGIAEGSGQELGAIVVINSRTEIMALAGADALPVDGPTADRHECTSAACLPEVTAGGHTLLGRNWDQDLRLLDNAVVITVRPADGPSLVMLTEAGILFRDGVNEAGIGVTGNSLSCEQDGQDVLGMPVSIIRRRMLRHASLAKAAKEVFQAPRSYSINHMLAAAGGGAIALEAAPRDVFWVLPQDGLLVHSNHFLDPRAAVTVRDDGPRKGPSTLYRHLRVRRRLAQNPGAVAVADMQAAFGDHFGWPESVCSHPKGENDRHPTGTVASIVMDLDARRMHVAPHPACESEWTSYAVA
ncbi:MAG TPA: C45 family peptidase [Trueperaceae bacterium]|nr:C45 family peptidase [Trueperaceae bacterium]